MNKDITIKDKHMVTLYDMNKDIKPYNDKYQRHGYWQEYWSNGNLWIRCNYVNGNRRGYCEEYYSNGKLWYKKFYIK